MIINNLKDIINENNTSNKFHKIYNLFDKFKRDEINNKEIKNNEINEIIEPVIYRNEINLIYKTENKGKQNIFGIIFVSNNKNNIELIINGIKSKLIYEYDLEKGINNIKLIIKRT